MIYESEWKVCEERDEFDDDKLVFILRSNECVYGKVEIEVLHESYEYEFVTILSKLEFANEFRREPIVKFVLVEVEPIHRGKGAARYLLTESFKKLRLAGFNQWFLNASPLDKDGLTLEQLEQFYSKFGFHKEQMRKESTLMWFKDNVETFDS